MLLPHLSASLLPAYQCVFKEDLICRQCSHSRSRVLLQEGLNYITLCLPQTSEDVTLEQLWSRHFASEGVEVGCLNPLSDHFRENSLHFKKLSLHLQPELLIIHLRRFVQNRKLRSKIYFPLTLNFIHPHKHLQAVIKHIGPSIKDGHNVAFVQTPLGWFKFDDIHVNPVPVREMLNTEQDCYLLFYM